MQAILSHPFRLLPSGAVATVLQGSDDANAEALAILALTGPSERELDPLFGLSDPTFDRFSGSALQAAADQFGPEVVVTRLVTNVVDPRTEAVTIQFTSADPLVGA